MYRKPLRRLKRLPSKKAHRRPALRRPYGVLHSYSLSYFMLAIIISFSDAAGNPVRGIRGAPRAMLSARRAPPVYSGSFDKSAGFRKSTSTA